MDTSADSNASRREQLADAAIETLAVAGLRGLTHRAVDRRAGVPEGACSNCFRTRQALLQAAVDRLAEVDAAVVAGLPAPVGANPAERAAQTALLVIEHWTTVGRARALARHELLLEATRRPGLRAALTTAAVQVRRPVVELLAAAGVPESERRAKTLIACVDGLIFEYLAGPDGLDLDPAALRGTLVRLMHGIAG